MKVCFLTGYRRILIISSCIVGSWVSTRTLTQWYPYINRDSSNSGDIKFRDASYSVGKFNATDHGNIYSEKTKILVSYVSFEDSEGICQSNLNFFLSRGFDPSVLIFYSFTVVGNSDYPRNLRRLASVHRNIELRNSPQRRIDLFDHAEVIKKGLSGENILYYFCLNCGVRGPFISPRLPVNGPTAYLFQNLSNAKWLYPFIAKLNKTTKVHAVGPTISCEISPHIQSYSIAFDDVGAKIASSQWAFNESYNSFSKSDLVKTLEVGLSALIIQLGYGIESLMPPATNKNECNPTVCRTKNCPGLDPCTVILVKNGGEVYRQKRIAASTLQRLSFEETNMCTQHQPRPKYIFSQFANVLSVQLHRFHRRVETGLFSRARELLHEFGHKR